MKGVIRRLCGSLAAATSLLVALTAAQKPQQTARFVVQHDWVGKGQWIRGDTHVHTRFSDGGHSPADVATQAVKYGCEVIGFADHADRKLKGASPEYIAAIQAVRKTQPALDGDCWIGVERPAVRGRRARNAARSRGAA